MNNANDIIRSFGMSGMLITDDIRTLEQNLNIELGHVRSTSSPSHIDFYPQFEQDVRAEAAKMAEHYEVFYCLEKSIRKLITESCQDADGESWWSIPRIPKAIVDDCAARAQKEIDSGITPRSDEPIDYSTFGELSVIISSNWSLFSTTFKSKLGVQRVLSNLNLLRGPIAHCTLLTEDEATRLRTAVGDWFRMIG